MSEPESEPGPKSESESESESEFHIITKRKCLGCVEFMMRVGGVRVSVSVRVADEERWKKLI